MTDLERFVELYKSFGIECIVNPVAEGYRIYLAPTVVMSTQDTVSEKFSGNEKSFSRVCFDTNGVFIKQDFE